MHYDYDLKNPSRKGKLPYKPKKIVHREFSTTLPPLQTTELIPEGKYDDDKHDSAVSTKHLVKLCSYF
jgi:hypothetical protein